MIRILHLVHAFQTGGAERVILDLTRHNSPGIANYVCSLCEPHDLVSQLDSATGFECLKKRPGNDLRIARDIARIIDREHIDVVHAQGWGTFIEGLIAANWYARRRPAFIHAFHGKSLADVTHRIPTRRLIAQRIAHLFTEACIAPADHMADDYAQTIGIRREKIEVIYNGVDLERFGHFDQSDARNALGLAESDFVVGFVGRLDPVKDIQGIVRIFARVRETLRHDSRRVLLLIVGDGTELAGAELLASDLGVRDRVVFAGLRSDVPRCLAAMDVYLQPSYYEGHSIAMLEAMAAGLPIVSTLVGGTSELVCDGRTGFLHSSGAYDPIATSIVDLYRQPDLRSAMGGAGRERVATHFSVAKMAEQYEDLYRRILRTSERSCVG